MCVEAFFHRLSVSGYSVKMFVNTRLFFKKVNEAIKNLSFTHFWLFLILDEQYGCKERLIYNHERYFLSYGFDCFNIYGALTLYQLFCTLAFHHFLFKDSCYATSHAND